MILDSTGLAAQKVLVEAINRAPTIELATVSAVATKTVTLLLSDGMSLPGATVIGPYVPRVGDAVRIARQGALTFVLGGLAIPTAKTAYFEVNASASVTSTSLAPIPSPGPWFVSFVAPRSREVIVHIRARITPTATGRGTVSARITNSTGSSVIDTETAVMVEAAAGGGAVAAGSFARFGSLTAGTTYRAEMVATSHVAGQTITVQNPRILVQPVI